MPEATPQERFDAAFLNACRSYGRYEAFSDFVRIYAAEIAFACGNRSAALMDERESIAGKADEERLEDYRRMFDAMVEALQENPNQDFLGGAYMRMKVGDRSHGQFFTPYHLAALNARIVADGAEDAIKDQGFASLNEPSCGAAGMAVAMAMELRRRGYNYQQRLFFVGQDLADLPALMAYLQCSLLGIAGYVIVGDTLRGERRMVLWTPMMLDLSWQMRLSGGDVPWPRDL